MKVELSTEEVKTLREIIRRDMNDRNIEISAVTNLGIKGARQEIIDEIHNIILPLYKKLTNAMEGKQ